MAEIEIKWLENVRILLIGNYVPAPMAAYFLKMLGAEVVKVERGKGDFLRYTGNTSVDVDGVSVSSMFAAINSGFKSIQLEYQTAEGALILSSLIKKADVLIDGSKAGMLEKYLGIAPDKISNQLIYIPISAYGIVGPMASFGGHDNNILGFGGNLSYTNTSQKGNSSVFSAPVADFFAAQSAAFACLAALIAKSQGKLNFNVIDASMLHAGFFLNFLEIADQNIGAGKSPKADVHWVNGEMPNYRCYTCKDDKQVFFGAMEQHLFIRFLEFNALNEWIESVHDKQNLHFVLENLFKSKTRSEWIAINEQLDVCISPINDLEEALSEPQINALGLVHEKIDTTGQKNRMPGFPLSFGSDSRQPKRTGDAPILGADTVKILKSLLNLNDSEIEALSKKGVIGIAQ